MKKPNTRRLNAEWHQSHRMPVKAKLEQRIAWHLEHQQHCACRPIPKKLLATMKERNLV